MLMTGLAGEVFISGVAEAPLGEVRDHSELSMIALAAREALADAGLTLADVDGLFVNYLGEAGTVQVGEYLGIQPTYSDSSDLGGAAFVAFLGHASAALQTARCTVALVVYASRQRTRASRTLNHWNMKATSPQFEQPYGLPAPIGQFGLLAARHIYEFGTTPEQLASVAVTARQWAGMNPKAWQRDPLTIDDVLESRMICDPLHRLDCCLITDGGGAVVLTTGDRARDADNTPIRVAGTGESARQWHIAQLPSLAASPGVAAARSALQMANVVHRDIDIFEPYDASTISVLLALEDVGFCARGEAGAFVQAGSLTPTGTLPSITSGGGLSYCHPGALGILLVIEAVRQLRGQAGLRQVPGATVGLVHGIGGLFSTAATAVLVRG
ncbi:acetyl-CoA acetyltransferase [Cryobacterium sp. Y57]|uniref:acetyl-CoA acetyltransferase n=1 Tax=Cryobacterium sp. Y57 TaxID=2048287 RepID=UPI0018ECA604|nr:acetyl-CoA acetyltransferase [Cryobacterium sp. Y57]